MDKFKAYKISHIGLKREVHRFSFDLNETFFSNFESSLIQQSDIKVWVMLDKSHEPYLVEFDVQGTYQTECDKCAATVPVEIEGSFEVFVKFTENPELIGSDDPEILYMHRDQPDIDLTKYLYEFAHLSIPIHKTCNEPFKTSYCDMSIAQKLEKLNESIEEKEEIDPRWSQLFDLKNKKL